MKIDVSIIYVNYYTSHLIKDSIQSIIEQVEGIEYEIIIVDNNSEPDLKEIFSEKFSKPLNIKFIFLKENIGFGRANNEAAKIAQGVCLFFLNPDTLLVNDAIKILFDFLKNHPQTGACGGNLTDLDRLPIFSYRKHLPGVKWDFHELTHHIFTHPVNKRKVYYNFSHKPIKVAYISGANLMVKRDVFNLVKGFDPDLFMYWDDVEICRRIKQIGYEIFNVPQAKICHLESRSFESPDLKNTYKIELQEKYRIVYLKKNCNKLQYYLSNLLYKFFLDSRIFLTKRNPIKNFYISHKKVFNKYRRVTNSR